jgi:hypothetical protein
MRSPATVDETNLRTLPDDCVLANLTACAAAWGVSERKAKLILDQEQIPIVELGPRTRAVTIANVREVLHRRSERGRGQCRPASSSPKPRKSGGI